MGLSAPNTSLISTPPAAPASKALPLNLHQHAPRHNNNTSAAPPAAMAAEVFCATGGADREGASVGRPLGWSE
jgi:hypothetical protein